MLSKISSKINLKKKRYYVISAVLLIVLIMVIGGNQNDDANLIKSSVSRGDIVSQISLSGKVEASDNVSLRFNTSGTISDIYVTEGQAVTEGQRLMSLDNRSLNADLSRAVANLELKKAEAKVSNAESDRKVESAYIALLNNDLQAYPKDIQQDYDATVPVVSGFYTGQQEGVYNLDVYSSNAQSGYSFRYSGLENQGTGTINEYSISKLGNKGLYLQFDADGNYGNTDWVIPIPNNRSSTYAAALNKYNDALASRDASESSNISLEISQAKIKQAEAEVSGIQADINERILRAPFSGTVSFIGPSKGEIASSTDIAVSLLSQDNFEIKIQIPEVDLSKIEKGQKTEIELDAYPGEKFSGYVVSVDQVETLVDGVSVYEALVFFDEQNPKIKSGMTAKVNIFSGKKESVLRVEKQFIETDEVGEYVTVFFNEKEIKTYVTTGFVGTDGFVEILGGVMENDIITSRFE